MSWPRESLPIALLVLLAPWASADTITVNTVNDSVANDGKCSLREAVEYFNRSRPENGYMGCKTKDRDEVDAVDLPVTIGPYRITNGAIRIHTSLAVNGKSDSSDEHAKIQVSGPQRAFVISNDAIYDPPVCAATSSCGVLSLDANNDNIPDGVYVTDGSTPHFIASVSTRELKSSVPQSPTVTRNTYTDYSLLIRLYATAKGGEREEVGTADVVGDGDDDADFSITSSTLKAGEYVFEFKLEVTPVSETVEDVDSSTVPATVTVISTTPIVGGETGAGDFIKGTTLVIHDAPSAAVVSFRQVDIQGCGDTSSSVGCATSVDGSYAYSQPDKGLSYNYVLANTGGHGGIIYSNEDVKLNEVTLSGGTAAEGGALYLTDAGGTEIVDTELRQNKAGNGAAIFANFNSLNLTRSLVTENEVTGSGAVLEVANSAIPASGGFAATLIENTTVSGNLGLAISLHDNMQVNATTVVLNSAGGINFNGATASVYNSIVAGNHTTPADPALPVGTFQDCVNFGALSVMDTSLVITGDGCPVPASGNRMQMIDNGAVVPNQLLMATDVAGGKCNSDFGLLCPLDTNGSTLRSHKPRVLSGYASVADSPIVNKGASLVSAGTGTCPGADQRNETRLALSCDIGAIELQQVSGDVDSGGAISFGQTYTQSLGDHLRDEELLRVVFCPLVPPALPATVVPGSYRPDVPGCPWVQKKPSKGRVQFLLDGSYAYTPASDFHGFDRFEIRVITTVSVLNADPQDQSRLVLAQVVVEPASGISSSSVAGAADGFGLALLALLGLRTRARWRKQA